MQTSDLVEHISQVEFKLMRSHETKTAVPNDWKCDGRNRSVLNGVFSPQRHSPAYCPLAIVYSMRRRDLVQGVR